MSRMWLGILLILFGILFLLNSADLISADFCLAFLNLARRYWAALLVLLGLQLTLRENYPDLSRSIKWLIILLISFWIYCMFFSEREWII